MVWRSGGLGVTSWEGTSHHSRTRGLRENPLSCMLMRRVVNAGVIAVSNGCNGMHK